MAPNTCEIGKSAKETLFLYGQNIRMKWARLRVPVA